MSLTIRAWTGALALLLIFESPLGGQLRPLEPLASGAFTTGADAPAISVRLGGGRFTGQRASLAGTEGDLIELGNVTVMWRTGRVAIEAGGTALRLFDDRVRLMEPAPTVDPRAGPDRRDVGDFRVATSVRVTPRAWRPVGFVRFGTRLPTTDDRVGLDRDRTDFFSTLGVHWVSKGWSLFGEAGLGIHGTHHPRLEQSDVLIYTAGAEYDFGGFAPRVALLGHADGMPGAIRGNEELSELRVGGRAGDRVWLSAYWVRGLAGYSPAGGVLIAAGWTR